MSIESELDVGRTQYLLSERAGRKCLKRIAPYDETEYHWALSNAAGDRWTIYRYSPGRLVQVVRTDSAQEVTRLCKERDEALHLGRTGGIW